MAIDYNKLISNLKKSDLNKILRNADNNGFRINGFTNSEKASNAILISTLKNKKKQADIFLNEICKMYDTENLITNIKNKQLSINDITQLITDENKIGVVSSILLGNPELAEEAMNLLDIDRFVEDEIKEFKDEEDNGNENITNNNLNIINEIDDTGSYLCKIEHRQGLEEYYFIKPIFCIRDNWLDKIVGADSFGSTGKIKISVPKQLKSKNIEYYKFYISNINKQDIYFPPQDENGEIKAQIFEDRIYDSLCETDEKNIFEIIKIDDAIDINEFKRRKEGIIRNRYSPISRKIYIENRGFLYGPFGWKNENDNLEIHLLGTSFFVNRYKISDLQNSIYYISSDNNYEEERKIIYNNKLNIQKPEFDFIDDNTLKDMISKYLSNSRSEKILIRNRIRDLDEINLSEERKERVVSLFKTYELVDDTIDDIISNMLNDEVKVNQIIDKILNNPNYLKKVTKSPKIKSIEDEIEEKKNILKEIEKNIEQVKENKLQEKIKEKSDDIEKLEKNIEEKKNEKEAIENEIKKLANTKNIVLNTFEWEKRAEEAENTFKVYSKDKIKLEEQIEGLSLNIKQQMANVSFNGFIASKMLKAANDFEKEDNKNKEITVLTQNLLPELNFNDNNEVIDYIYEYIVEKCNRTSFSRNDIINVLLCIAQGFLTVFAGPPGTGKTSLCDLLGVILGLSRSDKYNRYLEVSVEKGWTSKRDFIGYYNPLTKNFDKADKTLFSAFETLNAENNKNIEDYPYVILLDEANLSSMEHYWADFMNVCDFDKSKRMINLSEDFTFSIPNTLRFLATINYDHTTEILSPRLIDRAWIILLNSSDENIEEIDDYDIEADLPIISFEYFREVFGANKKISNDKDEDNLSDEISIKFNEIYRLFREENISISPRVLKMIRRYCVVGEKLFDNGDNIYVALDYAVAQKILPLINGYGDSYRNFLLQLQEKCDKSSMPKCNDIIKDIIKSGDKNMQYYQFFIR